MHFDWTHKICSIPPYKQCMNNTLILKILCIAAISVIFLTFFLCSLSSSLFLFCFVVVFFLLLLLLFFLVYFVSVHILFSYIFVSASSISDNYVQLGPSVNLGIIISRSVLAFLT